MSEPSTWNGRVIGFDLDMTLVDTSCAMIAALGVLESRLNAGIDVHRCAREMGTRPREQLGRWVPADKLDAAMRCLAEAFVSEGLPLVRPLPGAARLLSTLRAGGGSAVVVTTRRTRLALACLRRAGLAVDAVDGGLLQDGKAAALRSRAADCYLGDHPLDMSAALAAGAAAVGVTTGYHDAPRLSGAGARLVLPGLTGVDRLPAGAAA